MEEEIPFITISAPFSSHFKSITAQAHRIVPVNILIGSNSEIYLEIAIEGEGIFKILFMSLIDARACFEMLLKKNEEGKSIYEKNYQRQNVQH